MRKPFTLLVFVALFIGAYGVTPARAAAVSTKASNPTALQTPMRQPITRGDPTRPWIALTFDACQTLYQTPGFDPKIIAELTQTHTPATLFLGGLWMKSHPAQTHALATAGLFELGDHSWDHPDFMRISPLRMASEITQTQAIMRHLTGHATTLFRFPYGHYTPQAVALVESEGLTPIQWDVVSGDPDPRVTAQRMINAVITQARNGSIIVMHINGRGWHTAEALPNIITALRARGFQFVTVSQLLGR
ncbi:MAG: polysaccharide deacetylase family protein [Caldilineaceae bacterium]